MTNLNAAAIYQVLCTSVDLPKDRVTPTRVERETLSFLPLAKTFVTSLDEVSQEDTIGLASVLCQVGIALGVSGTIDELLDDSERTLKTEHVVTADRMVDTQFTQMVTELCIWYPPLEEYFENLTEGAFDRGVLVGFYAVHLWLQELFPDHYTESLVQQRPFGSGVKNQTPQEEGEENNPNLDQMLVVPEQGEVITEAQFIQTLAHISAKWPEAFYRIIVDERPLLEIKLPSDMKIGEIEELSHIFQDSRLNCENGVICLVVDPF